MGIIARVIALFREQPHVVVHDPTASKPRDLDDTFFDEEAQARAGKAISKSTRSSKLGRD
jgi:hypothetical protein